MSGESTGLIERFKIFDFYQKTSEHVPTQRTLCGGVFTLFTVLLLLYLSLSEIISYTSSHTEDVLTVDVRRNEKMPIHLDILFHDLSCRDVAVDVVDGNTGETLEDAPHQIIRQRISFSGAALADSRQAELGKSDEKIPDCLSCQNGIPPHLVHLANQPMAKNLSPCCNNCSSLRLYYGKIRVPQIFAENTPQCKISIPWGDEEGCRVYGFITVPRARGDFHIAAGKGYGQSHDSHSHHVHSVDWEIIDKFNITHTINSLSFGPPIPGIVNPLDGMNFTSTALSQQTYFIQVVPTIYKQGDNSILTNQFSFTQHYHAVDRSAQSFALPGLYFRYDISPIMIQITEKNRPLADLVTSLCAIVGGIYAAFGIVYALSSNVVSNTIKRKK